MIVRPGIMPDPDGSDDRVARSEEHTSELQSHSDLVCRLLLEKKKHRYCKTFSRLTNIINHGTINTLTSQLRILSYILFSLALLLSSIEESRGLKALIECQHH